MNVTYTLDIYFYLYIGNMKFKKPIKVYVKTDYRVDLQNGVYGF